MDNGRSWPGTQGASCTAAQSSTDGIGVDEGTRRLNEIMAGETFPRYVKIGNGRPTFQPAWTKESMALCNAVIKNITEELSLSKIHHDSWRSEQTPEERYKWREAKKQGCKQTYFERRQNQGWLDRKQVWNRSCQKGAVGSLVVKISGMKLDVGPGGADRIT